MIVFLVMMVTQVNGFDRSSLLFAFPDIYEEGVLLAEDDGTSKLGSDNLGHPPGILPISMGR